MGYAELVPLDLPLEERACEYITQINNAGERARERIFAPHFTANAHSMCLAVVCGIVRRLGERILLQSEVDAGSRFKVFPPAEDTEAKEGGTRPTKHQGAGVVFFVDDERSLVEIGCRMLSRLGFDPRGFDSSTDAFQAFEKNPGAVDLVVTDMTMPEMTGDIMADRMLALRKDLPLILCSGYSDSIGEQQAVARGIGAYLGKPFTMDELAEAIETVLGKSNRETDKG